MPRRIPVSQDGLAACPSCATHVRVDAADGDVVCPFCDHAWGVRSRVRAPRSVSRVGATIGGAILVAVQIACTSADVYGAPPDDDTGMDDVDMTEDVEGSGEADGSGDASTES